jgi:hypothetical protein
MLLILGIIAIIFLWSEHSRWERKRNGNTPLTAWDKMTEEQKLQSIVNNFKSE